MLTAVISDPVSIPEVFVYYWFVVCFALGCSKFNYSTVSLESFFTSLENLVSELVTLGPSVWHCFNR